MTKLFMTYWLFRSMPDYSASLPSGQTPGKVWRRTEPYGAQINAKRARHYVGIYGTPVPDAKGEYSPIYWFEVVLIEGPERRGLTNTDWSNQARYRDFTSGKTVRTSPYQL